MGSHLENEIVIDQPSEIATSGALKGVQSRKKQEQLDGVTGPRPVDHASVIWTFLWLKYSSSPAKKTLDPASREKQRSSLLDIYSLLMIPAVIFHSPLTQFFLSHPRISDWLFHLSPSDVFKYGRVFTRVTSSARKIIFSFKILLSYWLMMYLRFTSLGDDIIHSKIKHLWKEESCWLFFMSRRIKNFRKLIHDEPTEKKGL